MTLPPEIELDELGHHQAEAGERHGADDDAGGRGRDRDADHVAGAEREAVEEVAHARRAAPAPSGSPRNSASSGRLRQRRCR